MDAASGINPLTFSTVPDFARMKLASIQYDGRERVVAAVDGRYVVDVSDLGVPVADMIALIEQGPTPQRTIRRSWKG
jgi:hypothetical protein